MRRCAALMVAACLMAAGNARGTDCLLYPDYMRIVGGMPFENELECLVVDGDAAYVGGNYILMDDLLFAILDVSDPLDIQIVGSTLINDLRATSLAVAGNYAYFGTGGWNHPGNVSNLQIIDIAVPSAPDRIGSVPLNAWARDIIIDGDLLLMANMTSGLRIFDISDPSAPQTLSSTAMAGWALSIEKHGDYAYVGIQTGPDRIGVYDVSDPSAPLLVDTRYGVDNPADMDIHEGYLYVADTNNGLLVYDLHDPAHPVEVAHPAGSAICEALLFRDDRLYTAGFSSGLKLFDVSSPADPLLLSGIRLPQDANGLGVVGDHAILMGSGLMVVDLSHPEAAPLSATSAQLLGGNDVDVVGDLAYVAVGSEDSGALNIWDVGDPADVHLVGGIEIPYGPAIDVAVDGDVAYLTWFEFLHEISRIHLISLDVSDPTAIAMLGGDAAFHSFTSVDIAVGETHLFVASGNDQLITVDIGDPANLQVVSSMPMALIPYKLALAGDLLYVPHDYHGLSIYDVSDPTAPAVVGGTTGLGDCRDIVIDGDIAYLAGPRGFYTLDVSDSAAPQVIGQGGADAGMALNSLALREGRLYGNFNAGVEVFDVTDPARPEMIGTVSMPSQSSAGLYDLGDRLLTRLSTGLGYIALDCYGLTEAAPIPAGLARVEAWPNPFNPHVTLRFHLAAGGPIRLSLHDANGRLVSVLAERMFDAGEHRLVWDGRDAAGGVAPSGVYLARVESAGELKAAGKITLLR